MEHKEEFGWLIENDWNERPEWWRPLKWTTDANEAVRFARKEDAERVIREMLFANAHATEHIWS